MTQSAPFGLLLVDKPSGISSHDVVQQVRQKIGIRKVGHTGTLDPMATGLLVLCLGAATRLSEYLIKQDKRYQARIRFGTTTETHDAEGKVTGEKLPIPELSQIKKSLLEFVGEIYQVPPAHSALKVQGKRAYDLARAGEEVELAARPVMIHNLDPLAFNPPDLDVAVHCSSGTYIRSIARDLAAVLESGAHLVSLRRTQVGSFNIEDAHKLEELPSHPEQTGWRSIIIPAQHALPQFPAVILLKRQVEAVRHGRQVVKSSQEYGLARGLSQSGELVAILESSTDGSMWQPRKVFPVEARDEAS